MAKSRSDAMRENRLDNLKAWRDQGLDPYPAQVNRTHTTREALADDGLDVTITGRVISWREHGSLQFADVQDQSGKIQLVFKADVLGEDLFAKLRFFDKADFIEATGATFTTKAGERSVEVKSYRPLGKTLLPMPSSWTGLADPETRFRKRYLDMIINPDVTQRLVVRSKVITAIRKFLDDRGFIEVETPTLQPIYGGGFARPFSTYHNALDADFYLRISDEMYLKRLIVGGFEKVYEITKVFRNEGIDHDHNPEFTMFEAQIAFEDYRYGMDIFEEIVEYAALEALGTTEFEYQGQPISVKRPWKRMRVVEAIEAHTDVKPLEWRSIEDAKDSVRNSLSLNDEKINELERFLSIGEVIAFAFEEGVETKLIQPTLIYDYPIEVSPLAKKSDDPRFTQRFEAFAFGSEIGNNYTELNDPLDLRQRFVEEKEKEAAGFDEAHQTDYDYLEAIEHGFPPTCGLGLGIDRLIMLLTDAPNIKEVIAFPTLKPFNKSGSKVSTAVSSTDKNSSETPVQTFQLPNRSDTETLLKEWIQNDNLLQHCRMVARAMEAYAEKLGEDAELWYQTGLLHDLDWEKYPDEHPNKALSEVLVDYPESMKQAIAAHAPERTGVNPKSTLDKYLYACDELSGFLNAYALMRPNGFEGMKAKSVMKKLKDKSFAANVNRDDIQRGFELIGGEPKDHVEFLISVFAAN